MSKIFELVKEQYFWEAQRRDKLNNGSGIPIGFATLSATAISTTIANINYPFGKTEFILLGCLVLYLIVSGIFAYHTIRFFLGPIYKYVATSDEIVCYYENSQKYYDSYPEASKADAKFDDFLIKTYSKCATINCKNNDEKSNRLYIMNRTVLMMLVPSLIAGAVLTFKNVFQ